MGDQINSLDKLAWKAAIAGCALQKYIVIAIASIAKPVSLMDKAKFIGRYMSMEYLMDTPPNQMPDTVRKQMLLQGRFILAAFGFMLFKTIARLFL